MGGQLDASIPTGNEFYVDDSLGLKEDSKLLGSSNRGKSITSIATPMMKYISRYCHKTFPFIQYFIGLAG